MTYLTQSTAQAFSLATGAPAPAPPFRLCKPVAQIGIGAFNDAVGIAGVPGIPPAPAPLPPAPPPPPPLPLVPQLELRAPLKGSLYGLQAVVKAPEE